MTIYEKIQTEDLQNFTKKVIKTYKTSEKVSTVAEKTVDILHGLLEERGLIQQHGNQMFVDILTCAAMIHDVFDTREDWSNSFAFRRELLNLAIEHKMPEPIYNSLFETLESQLGNKMPVIKCRPQPGTPQDIFATAVWVANNV